MNFCPSQLIILCSLQTDDTFCDITFFFQVPVVCYLKMCCVILRGWLGVKKSNICYAIWKSWFRHRSAMKKIMPQVCSRPVLEIRALQTCAWFPISSQVQSRENLSFVTVQHCSVGLYQPGSRGNSRLWSTSSVHSISVNGGMPLWLCSQSLLMEKWKFCK